MHWNWKGRARALLGISALALTMGAADDRAPAARTPEQLAALAREHSPRARALALERKAAVRSAEGAGSFFDPMIEARIAPLSVPGLLPEDPHNPMSFGVEVMVAQKLPLSGRLGHERARAVAAGERTRHTVDAMLLDIEMEAARLACEAWQSTALAAVLAQEREVLLTMAGVTRAQIASGRASVGDAQRVDVELAMIDVELVDRDGERLAIDARTNALLGRAPDAPLPAPPVAVPWLLTEPPSLAVEERAEVRAEVALLEASEAERARAADAWIPDLTAQASWSSMWPLSHQFLVGVGAELPVFNGGRSAEQDSASLMREGALATLEDAKVRVNAELGAARARDQSAALVFAQLEEKVLPLAVARAQTARAALGGGADIEVALDATTAEIRVHTQLVRASAERCMSRAELWRAAGASFLTESTTRGMP